MKYEGYSGEVNFSADLEKKRKNSSMSMSLKLLICLAIFSLLVVAIAWVTQVLMSDALYANVKQREVETVSENIKELIQDGTDNISGIIERDAERYDVCVKLYSINDGEYKEECSVIVFVESLIANLKDDNVRHFYEQARKNKGVFTTRMAFEQRPGVPGDTDQELSIVSIHAEIIDGGDRGEYLVLINSVVTPIETAKKTIFAQFSYIMFFLIIGTIATAFLLSKLISKPLSGMNESAKQLAQGNYDVNFDVSGYREINELSMTLNYAAKELSKNDNLQKELIANISHDLRTPLTMIKGYSEMMRDIPGENTPENVQAIIDETERLSMLVNDLLDLSKIESGTKELVAESFDFTEAVTEVIERYEKMNSAKGYNIEFVYDESVYVSADKSMILQVIYNLINNAINYCGDDLYIGVRQKVLNDKNGKSVVRISIVDHGVGIAPDKLPLIWDRYYKVDGVHRRAAVGTGLGLSIVKKILTRHNASYGVESKLGEGSTFWFELPTVEK